MDHVKKFNNLGGSTIGEHRKNFNLYLKNISNLNATDIATVLENIKPKNHQEAILQIELLSEYEQYEALEEILLTSNKYLNKKLTRNLQLIKYLIDKYSPQEFVDKLCPKISYITRINIINILSAVLKDTDLAEEYFKAIFEKYGIKLAISALLVSCSETFIKNNITDHNIKITDKQLIKLHGKYPNLIEHYFSEDTPFNFSKSKKFGQYLAIHDINAFYKLSQEGFPSIGRKGSYNLAKAYKKDIIENPEKYPIDILKPQVPNKVFSSVEFHEFFTNLLPASIDDFALDMITSYLKALPAKIRGTVLFETYEKKYDCKYSEDQLNGDLLNLLVTEDRVKFQLEEKFPEYLPITKSIDLIKEKIKFTSDITLRAELLSKLTKTCEVNNDLDALLNVLDYVAKRHKNEVLKVRQSFLLNLTQQFELEKLSEAHWNCIKVLIKIAEINGEEHWTTIQVYEKYIEFKCINGMDCVEDLKSYVKMRGTYGWILVREKPELERNCILKIGEFLDSLTFKRESAYDVADSFFEAISLYNTREINKVKISYLKYPDYLEKIFESLRRDRCKYAVYIPDLIKVEPENKEEEKLLQLLYEQYFETKPTLKCEYTLPWLLKNKPELVAANAEACFDADGFKLTPQFYYEASKMHYSSIYDKFEKTALGIVNNASSKASQIEPALLFLSFGYKYLDLLDKYQPVNYTIDIFEDNMKEMLAARKAVLNSLCFIPDVTKSIFKIYPYCKGDYLQHGIRPLYKAMYNIPQELIEDPINFLLQNKQSKEQGIYLVSNLSTSQRIREILSEIGSSEKSKSIGKFIFKRTFNLLSNFPDEEFWNLVLNHFQLIDPNDSESFQLLLEIYYIPIKYRPQYVRLVWDYAVQLKKQYQVVTILKLEIWKQLPKVFCEEILREIIFNDKNEEKQATEDLLYEYLLNGGDLSILYKKSLEAQLLYDFLVNICSKLMQESKRKLQALELSKKLTNSISEVPIAHHKFRIEILFESTYYFLQIEKNLLDTVLEFLLKKQDETIDKFGMNIALIYRDFAATFLNIVINKLETSKLSDRENKITDSFLQVAAKIAKSGNDWQVKLLALQLIPRKESKDKEFNRKRKEVIDTILANSDEVVEIYVANVYYEEPM